MISRILHPKEIEKATIRIECGGKSGTAFFISVDDNKQLLLTSEHNVPENEPIKLYVGDLEETDVVVLERIVDRDIVILSAKLRTTDGLTAIPLKGTRIAYNENWETYGFPAERIESGGTYNGTISRTNEGTKWDLDLECNQYNNLSQFDGLSGSALVIDGYVAGIVGYDNAGTLGATSIISITEKLIPHGIDIVIEKNHSIPESIEEDISDTSPNEEALDKINEVISNQIASSHFLISGSPGSGKTTLAAQLELTDINHVIVDRFFVKVPEIEEYPTQLRATSDFFMKWFEEVCYRELYNSPPPKAKSESTLNDRIQHLHNVIQELSNNYNQQGKIAFFIIDGLDDVKSSNRESFLSVVPEVLPSNFKLIISCTSKEILPTSVQVLINNSNEIKVTPLSLKNVEIFLSERLKAKQLNTNQISELAQKSEGHPLYLRYLIKYVLETDLMSIDDWINSIPLIGGEIENYYLKIWKQIENQADEIWLASTLSRLRVPIDKSILQDLVPEQTKHHFVAIFKKIQHLLRDTDLISIYHSSFADFVNGKTTDIDNQVHKNIAEFIIKHPTTIFGISEKVHHLVHGDEKNKMSALDECNQNWVDDCALNSVNPDIVLADIKDTIALASELGIAHKVIALLLLSQRVNFRYNTLFQENAIFLVNALLSLGKPEEAIRYVVRNRTLITADGDALYLLQKFYEYGANEEAEILLKAINKTCNNILDSDLDSDSFNRFIELKFSAVTLSSNSDFKEAYKEFIHIKNSALEMIEQSGNSKEQIEIFKDDVGSYNNGYHIWRFNVPPLSKKIEREMPSFVFTNRHSGYIALTIYKSLDFQEKSPKTKKTDNISDWIEDLEYVIDKYGTHSDHHLILLEVLLGRSKRVDIIEKLCQQVFPNGSILSFRNENGVDLNHQSIHRNKIYRESLGFLDKEGKMPELTKFGFNSNWEETLISLFQYTCFLNGKIKRYEIDGNTDKIKSLELNLNNLFDKLIPDLKSRIHWKRSYALPELIYPVIYKKVIQMLLEFFPEKIPAFTERITQKNYYQLGLYTEGYTDSLFVIARELAKKPDHNQSAFKVSKTLEEHIISTIENRWERNEYLLRLVEVYALLENHDKAKGVFKEMIDTSMGPSWYKEAQLGIINTVVSNIIPLGTKQSYLNKFAAHLHKASGEMTFQRYVKQQQEEFAGDLARIGLLNQSISYFKYLLFPDYKTIIQNAESGLVDMPFIGQGYVLGAKAIEEQSAILNMLQGINYKGSLFTWGLTELFILGDDRYLHKYAKLQAGILNHLELNDPKKLDHVFNRLARFVVAEISDELRYQYLQDLFNELSDLNINKAKEYLASIGMNPADSEQSTSDDKKDGLPRKEREDPLDILVQVHDQAQTKLDTENKTGARKIIVEALQDVQNQNYGIWSSMYSNKINNLRNLFSETYNNSSEFIKDIKGLIINEPYFDEWIIADQIISLLRNIDDENEKQLILSSVHEHIYQMVRTSDSFYNQYEWMNKDDSKVSIDEIDDLLLELLIWFLNHPSLIVKNRTIEILTWLGTTLPEQVVPKLITEIVSEGYKISKELSASVIHQICSLSPDGFSKILLRHIEHNEMEILGINHFMIKNTLIDSFKELKIQGINDFDNLIVKFEQTFVNSNKNQGDVILDEDYLEPIADFVYELNGLGILNKNFATTLFNQIKELSPLSIDECERANEYIDRSFNNFNEISIVSDFDTLLRYALNIAISSCASLTNKEQVANILRFYQPTFPENHLHIQKELNQEKFEKNLIASFEDGHFDFESMLINGEIPLSYFGSRYVREQRRSMKKIELTAYAIPIDQYTGEIPSCPWPVFSPNSYPNSIQAEEEIVVPFFIRSVLSTDYTGSEIVPAVANPFIDKLFPGLLKNSKSIYWRRSRNWDNYRQGIAEYTGYFTTISQKEIDNIKSNYKLIWQIAYQYELKYIDVFEQKEIEK